MHDPRFHFDAQRAPGGAPSEADVRDWCVTVLESEAARDVRTVISQTARICGRGRIEAAVAEEIAAVAGRLHALSREYGFDATRHSLVDTAAVRHFLSSMTAALVALLPRGVPVREEAMRAVAKTIHDNARYAVQVSAVTVFMRQHMNTGRFSDLRALIADEVDYEVLRALKLT